MASPRPLERLLAVFSKVQPGEGAPVVILMFDLFLLLTAYYLLKPVREQLILGLTNGAVLKSYSAALQAALLLGIVPAYGWLGSRVSRKVLINVVSLIFVGSFVLFFLLYKAGASIGIPFFLWMGIFNILIISQFWSLANELFSPAQGKRLFSIIAFGGTLGAIVGAKVAGLVIKATGAGTNMLLAAGLILGATVLTMLGAAAAKRGPRGEDADAVAAPEQEKPLGKDGGFKLVAKVRYLRLIAAMVLVYNIANTMGEFILGSHVKNHATEVATQEVLGATPAPAATSAVPATTGTPGVPAASAAQPAGAPGAAAPAVTPEQKKAIKERSGALIGEFYADFYFWVNLVTALLQALVVSRIARFLGVRVGLLLVPLLAIGGYLVMAILPVLFWVRVAKISENSVDYSLHNTLRQMLWLPTTPEEKYKAKNAVETFFVRFGDMASAGVVYVGVQLALGLQAFAMVTVGIGVVWLFIVVLVGREHDVMVAKRGAVDDAAARGNGLPKATALPSPRTA